MTDREQIIKDFEHAVNKARGDYYDYVDLTVEDADKILKLLEEQKHGHWIERDEYYECSACKEPWVLIDGTPLENGMYFCPKCGARMESEVKQE